MSLSFLCSFTGSTLSSRLYIVFFLSLSFLHVCYSIIIITTIPPFRDQSPILVLFFIRARVCVCACVLSPDYSAKPCLIRFSNILFYCYTTATIIEFSLFSSSFLLSLCVCVFNSLVFPLFHTLCFWNSTTTTTIFYLFVGFFHWHTHTHTHLCRHAFVSPCCLFVCLLRTFFLSFFFFCICWPCVLARASLFVFLSFFFFRYLSCSWRFPLSFFFLAKDDKEEKKKITTTKEINSNDFLVHRFSADVIL
jgi:hypothetical protein